MGEYLSVAIYKPMKPVSLLSDNFEKLCWQLYRAKDDINMTEQIYRSIGFVQPSGAIFNLNMRFIERDAQVYQSNDGLLGAEKLPNLSLFYKFEFHDFWLSILKPNELIMNNFNTIEVELFGKTIHERFQVMEKANQNQASFEHSAIYKHYHVETPDGPPIRQLIADDDLIQLYVGQIYYKENEDYRTTARKSITQQRKTIATQANVPHWTKKTPY